MIVARRFLVRGRVQGVGFRYFTAQAAGAGGIHGWVRNTPAGDVEIEAEGDREAMCRFEMRVRLGPPASRVDAVDTDEVEPTGRTSGFAVRG
jgi:acylphosphatase